MGTPSGLDVALGNAKANLSTFTPQELKQVLDHQRRLIQPAIHLLCPSKRILWYLNKTRTEWPLVGGVLISAFLNENALGFGSCETRQGERVAEGVSLCERMSITQLFLTRKSRLVLWEARCKVTMVTPAKPKILVTSETLADITEVSEHEALTPELIYACQQITMMEVGSMIDDRARQLGSCNEVYRHLRSFADRCGLS